ncbi:hypothetical protein D1872_167590 [compost metagenome]
MYPFNSSFRSCGVRQFIKLAYVLCSSSKPLIKGLFGCLFNISLIISCVSGMLPERDAPAPKKNIG